MLGGYDYKIAYRQGGENANADGLSQLPLPEVPVNVPEPGDTILSKEHPSWLR